MHLESVESVAALSVDRIEPCMGSAAVLPTGSSLSRATLRDVDPRVRVPSYQGSELDPTFVHLGLGSFARAHLCTYLDELAERRISRSCGLVAGGLRTASIESDLRRQDRLWTVHPGSIQDARVVGVLREYVDAVRDAGRLLRAMTDPRCRIVTLTVTAAAYLPAPGGRQSGGTDPFDLIAEALDRRRVGGMGPLTVVSCDNLPDNQAATRAALGAAALRRSPELARWTERHVAVPRSMVDRISYCAPPQRRADLQRELGVADELTVMTEPFSQWVLTDEFAAGRPPLEDVGVRLVSDVAPFVEAKTRILNGTHVALGYLGSRGGFTTAAEAMADQQLSGFVRRMIDREVLPGLAPAEGLALTDYRDATLRRLADSRLEDPLARLCRRGSVRVQNYVLPSLADALAAGRPHSGLVLVLAAWVSHLAAAADRGGLAELEDPRAAELAPLAQAARRDPRPLLATQDVFGDLGRDPRLIRSLRRALAELDGEDLGAEAS
jgi:mannitol 2-dehydrogenase